MNRRRFLARFFTGLVTAPTVARAAAQAGQFLARGPYRCTDAAYRNAFEEIYQIQRNRTGGDVIDIFTDKATADAMIAAFQRYEVAKKVAAVPADRRRGMERLPLSEVHRRPALERVHGTPAVDPAPEEAVGILRHLEISSGRLPPL